MVDMGYSMSADYVIIRRKHMVRFSVGWPVERLLEELHKVPRSATVDEVLIDEDSGILSIEFHQEYLDNDYMPDMGNDSLSNS